MGQLFFWQFIVDVHIMVDFFQVSLYRKELKYWSNQTFDWKYIRKASLRRGETLGEQYGVQECKSASVALSAEQERHTECVSRCLKSMWNVYGCERDKTNFAILNFSAMVDLLEKRRERSSAELLEGELNSRLSSERSNVTEKFGLQVLLSTVLFHMLLSQIAVWRIKQQMTSLLKECNSTSDQLSLLFSKLNRRWVLINIFR